MRAYRIAIVLLLAMAVATVGAAQPSQQSVQPVEPAAQQPPQQPAPGQGAVQPATPEELVAKGEIIVNRGLTTAKAVRTMLDDARKDADIIRITCLDNKLTQINTNLRNAEARLEKLRKAVDADLRMHEYTVLNVLGQKLQVLDQEAHQCVGEALYETGQTTVVTEIDTEMLPFGETPSTPPVVPPPSLPTLPPPATIIR